MSAYYNEHDPKAAAWLRELIKEGLIAPGDVDERSIIDVRPHEISGYIQQHFFAGIGGWSLALRLAGWPDSRPARTGSCPCQPFSQAGKRKGTADERHLWPAFRDLITFGEPTVTFGEQVASNDGRAWLAGVCADLEALGYAVGAADLCAAGVGAPHIRQRLYWVANATAKRYPDGNLSAGAPNGRQGSRAEAVRCGEPERLVLPNGAGRHTGRTAATTAGHGRAVESAGGARRLGDSDNPGPQGRSIGPDGQPDAEGREAAQRPAGLPSVSGGVADCQTNGREQECQNGRGSDGGSETEGRAARFGLRCTPRDAWSDFDIIPCGDGKARRVESGTFPLAHGIPGRVGLLRGYGNAIVPQVAAEFIKAYIETLAPKQKPK